MKTLKNNNFIEKNRVPLLNPLKYLSIKNKKKVFFHSLYFLLFLKLFQSGYNDIYSENKKIIGFICSIFKNLVTKNMTFLLKLRYSKIAL